MKCVYKIINILNGKFYIGSTKNSTHRWREHLRDLKKNKHHNSKLQNAWNKYGSDKFIFEHIETFPDDYEDVNLLKKEQYYIDKFNPCNDLIGYNVSPSAHGGWRGIVTKKSRRVNQFDLSGKFIRKWKNAAEIYKQTGWRVYDCLTKRQRSNFGFLWCYENESPTIYKNYGDNTKCKPVIQLDKQGNFIKKWQSLTQAMKELNIKGIGDAANGYGGRKTAHGFIWKFEE